MGRRGIKEYRAAEALTLIAADRDQKPLVCPSCGSAEIERVPRRASKSGDSGRGKIALHCAACGRSAGYIDKGGAAAGEASPEKPARY